MLAAACTAAPRLGNPCLGTARSGRCHLRPRMVYTFPGGGCVDLAFEATPVSIYSTRSVAPLGYVACMWASYMGRTDGREIHFRGQRDGGPRDEWIAFGSEPRTTEARSPPETTVDVATGGGWWPAVEEARAA